MRPRKLMLIALLQDLAEVKLSPTVRCFWPGWFEVPVPIEWSVRVVWPA